MDRKTYESLKPGDRLIVEHNGRLRTARVVGWTHRVLVCRLKRFMMNDWCRFAVPIYRGECVQITSTQGQQHLRNLVDDIVAHDETVGAA